MNVAIDNKSPHTTTLSMGCSEAKYVANAALSMPTKTNSADTMPSHRARPSAHSGKHRAAPSGAHGAVPGVEIGRFDGTGSAQKC